MEKEFELTLNLLKEQKNLYFEKIKTLINKNFFNLIIC